MTLDELLSKLWDVAHHPCEAALLALDKDDCRTLLDELDRLKNHKCVHEVLEEWIESASPGYSEGE